MSISLTVLGCSTPYPRPGAPCSGYLVRTSGVNLWVDCGGGTFAALQEHLAPGDVDALWISHMHPDHCADLLSVFSWALNAADAPRLPVYGPPGWAARLAAMLPMDTAEDAVRDSFHTHEVQTGHATTVGNLNLISVGVRHSVPAFGLRVEGPAATLAYSGDTGPCAELIELATGADLFVCEAGAIEPQPAHCTPADAGRAAAAANAKQLLITHLPFRSDPSEAVKAAAEIGGCPTSAAHPGLVTSASD